MTFKDRITAIENGRFTEIAEALHVRPYCEDCYYWDKSLGINNSYRCAAFPQCIGVTLDDKVKTYIQQRIQKKGE